MKKSEKRSAADIDLLELPGISRVVNLWRSLLFANLPTRREAKMILFKELAEAVELNMPLDEALSRSGQTVAECNKDQRQLKRGTYTRFEFLNIIIGFIFGATSITFGLISYLPFAFRFADIERVARLHALRLLPLIEAGTPLSEAMRSCSVDYTEQEIALVKVGEETGNLAVALRELSHAQVVSNRLSVMASGLAMPLLFLPIALAIMAFVMTFISPKFVDIYRQLGLTDGQMGPMHLILHYTSQWPLLLLGVFLLFALVVLPIVWLTLNGNVTSITIVAIQCLLIMLFVAGQMATVLQASLSPLFGRLDDFWWFVLFFGVMVFGVLALPWILKSFEYTLLRYERYVRRCVGWLPVVGRAVRYQEETAWLGTLSMAVSAGYTAEESLRVAGEKSPFSLKRKTMQAAELAGKGIAIGEACRQAKVLATTANTRLYLLDGNPDYSEGIGSLAKDMAEDSYDILQRSARILEVVGIVLYGLFIGFFIISLYYPIFMIPTLAIGR